MQSTLTVHRLWKISILGKLHCVPKRIPKIIDCNLIKDYRILIMLGRNIPDKLATKRAFKFPPHPTSASFFKLQSIMLGILLLGQSVDLFETQCSVHHNISFIHIFIIRGQNNLNIYAHKSQPNNTGNQTTITMADLLKMTRKHA